MMCWKWKNKRPASSPEALGWVATYLGGQLACGQMTVSVPPVWRSHSFHPLRPLSLPVFPAHTPGSSCHEKKFPRFCFPFKLSYQAFSSLLFRLTWSLVASAYSPSSLPDLSSSVWLGFLTAVQSSRGPSWLRSVVFAQPAFALSMGCGSDKPACSCHSFLGLHERNASDLPVSAVHPQLPVVSQSLFPLRICIPQVLPLASLTSQRAWLSVRFPWPPSLHHVNGPRSDTSPEIQNEF